MRINGAELPWRRPTAINKFCKGKQHISNKFGYLWNGVKNQMKVAIKSGDEEDP